MQYLLKRSMNAFFALLLLALAGQAQAWKMEAGTLNLPSTNSNSQPVSVAFQQVYDVPPVVVALLPQDGFNSAALRIRNVTTTGFEIAQWEPPNWDGPHVGMEIQYLAVEPGVHTLPDGTTVEAGRITGVQDEVQFNGQPPGKRRWGNRSFAASFGQAPALVGMIQTMNNETSSGPGELSDPWMTLAINDLSTGSFDYALERSEVFDEIKGNNFRFNDLSDSETLGYIAMPAGALGQFLGVGNQVVDYEARQLDVAADGWDNGCDAIGFLSGFVGTPLAVATINSRRDTDGGWLRHCGINAGSIQLTIDEDTAQDNERNHLGEAAGLLAFSDAFIFDSEAPTGLQDQPFLMEADSVALPPGQVTSVSFDQVYPAAPAVFILGDNDNPEPSAARVTQVSTTGFSLMPVEPQSSNPQPDADTQVHYLVVSYGQHQMPDGTRLEVGQLPVSAVQGRNVSGNSWQSLGFLTSFGSTPALISTLQTANNEVSAPGGRSEPWMTLAHRNLGAGGVQIALDRAETSTGSVTQPEIAAYLAIEPGIIGTFPDNEGNPVDGEAQLTPDRIRGTVNCDTENFLQGYAQPPLVIGAQVSRDGGDGGWLRRCSVSDSTVSIKIEEDWANDRDLNHTTEEAAFVVFSRPFVRDFTLRGVYALEGPTWNGTAGEVVELLGSGRDGTAINGAQSSPARVCFGATLGAGSFVEVPHDPAYNFEDAMTVMAWVKADSIPTSGLKSIVSKDENFEFHINSQGEIFWWWNNGSGATRSFETDGFSVSPDTWHHIAITYDADAGEQRIVVDGVVRATQNYSGETLLANSDPLHIGADQFFAGREFDGQIDEVRLYARSLSLEAIQQEMNRTRNCPVTLDHFDVVVPSTASVCAPVDVQITARDAGGNLFSSFTGTVTLTTSAGHGLWSRVSASGSLSPDPDTSDDGQAQYTFASGDNGQVTLGLANERADELTIRVEASGGESGQSGAVQFQENTIVISLDDALGDDLIAGRDHGLQAEVLRRDPNTGDCGRVTAYDGNIGLRAWLDREVDDPGGAAPTLDGGNGPATVPDSRPASPSVTVSFSQGLASLDWLASDVGHYALNLEDSDSGLVVDENGAPLPVTGTSAPLTVRPFGFAVSVDGNPGAGSASGPAFQAAGRDFTVRARAVAYDPADDSDTDGQPDGHDNTDATDNANLADNASTTAYDAGVDINGYLTAGPSGAVDPGLTGLNGLGGFSNGEASGQARYNEVGSIEIGSLLDGTYLGRTVRVEGRSGHVGRFHPEEFTASVSQSGSLAPWCNTFSYTGQPLEFGTSPQVSLVPRAFSSSGTGPQTENYQDAWQKLTLADISRQDPVTDRDQIGAEGDPIAVSYTAAPANLVPIGDGSLAYVYGDDQVIYDREPNALIASFPAALELRITDVDDGEAALAPADAPVIIEPLGHDIRYGRMKLENAFGPETRNLIVPFSVQVWNGSRFVTHADEDCWNYDTSTPVITDQPPSTSAITRTDTLTDGQPPAGSELELQAPGSVGEVTLTWPVDSWWQDDFDGDGTQDDPAALVRFGVYRGNDRVIYWREAPQ